MNQLFCLLLAACTMGSANSQNCFVTKGTAYERTTIPGNIPRKTLDESGKEVERPIKKLSTYFIYIESKPGCHVLATRIWIGGKAYHVTQEEIMTTPVIIQHSHPGTPADTLVKQTNNKVLRLQQKEELKLKPDRRIKKN